MRASQPSYPHERIWSVSALCSALTTPEHELRAIAEQVPTLYLGPMKKLKKSGKGFRDVYDTKPPLKSLLKKINEIFFRRVIFPGYLHGSIKGCDFLSNARTHRDSVTLITLDIKGFFDHITEEQAFVVWRRFFGFGDEPAQLLTRLVTNGGKVFQGAPTSPYLANLVFWDIEPRIVQSMSDRGLRYSRFVDDISISHRNALSNEAKTWAIAQVYGMLGSRGFAPERNKQAIANGHASRTIMRINVNGHPTITRHERQQVRAMVHCAGVRAQSGENSAELRHLLRSASGKIGRMQRLHPTEAAQLRVQARATEALLNSQPFITEPQASSGSIASSNAGSESLF